MKIVFRQGWDRLALLLVLDQFNPSKSGADKDVVCLLSIEVLRRKTGKLVRDRPSPQRKEQKANEFYWIDV